METKICTSIEQSKKLIELGLDKNTADMIYIKSFKDDLAVIDNKVSYDEEDTPAWSLKALLESAPKYFSELNHQFVQTIQYDHNMRLYYFIYRDYQHGGRSKTVSSNKDLLDGAYEMIVWLYKNGYMNK